MANPAVGVAVAAGVLVVGIGAFALDPGRKGDQRQDPQAQSSAVDNSRSTATMVSTPTVSDLALPTITSPTTTAAPATTSVPPTSMKAPTKTTSAPPLPVGQPGVGRPPGPKTPGAPGPGNMPGQAPKPSAGYVDRVIELTNAERARAGLKPLARSGCLQSGAQKWSVTMADQQRMYHNSLSWIMTSCGMRGAGENVAAGYRSPEAVVSGWMNSPGHRANILNPSFTAIGVGYDGRGMGFVTQNFGTVR